MVDEEIFEKSREILAEITGLEKEEIFLHSSLLEDLGVESFDLADLNFKIQEVFNIDTENIFLSVDGIVGNPEYVDENNCLMKAGLKEMKKRIPSIEITEEMMRDGKPLLEILNKVTLNDLITFIKKSLVNSGVAQ